MEILLFISLILIGFFISFICSMVGLGGGILFIPILILVYKISSQMAVGISILAMTATTTSATIGYFKYKCVDWKLGIIYDILDIPGVMIGAYITTLISNIILEIICGLAIIILGLSVIFQKKSEKDQNSTNIRNNYIKSELINEKSENFKEKIDYSYAWRGKRLKYALISSFLGGLITGMVGLGGGITDTTTMILLGVPINVAAGSSSFAMLLTNITGFLSHSFLGNINLALGISLAIGAFIGAQFGSHIAIKVNKNILRKILAIIAIFSGIRLLI